MSGNAREALNKAGRRAGAKLIGRHWDAADEVGMDIARKNGNSIESITPEELKNWRARMDKIFTEYLGKMGNSGYDGESLLADLKATVKSIR